MDFLCDLNHSFLKYYYYYLKRLIFWNGGNIINAMIVNKNICHS
jgi:hypothetical protein